MIEKNLHQRLFVHCILRRNNAPQAQKTEGDRGRNPSFSQAKLAGSLFATKENVMDRRPTHARVVVSLRLIFFVMALIVTDSQIALAQREKLPVFVDYLGDDSVGSNVVFQFKEAIRRSASYQLVMRREDAGITVSIVTIEVDGSARSAASVVATTGYRRRL
jgi:hypothetical protein